MCNVNYNFFLYQSKDSGGKESKVSLYRSAKVRYNNRTYKTGGGIFMITGKICIQPVLKFLAVILILSLSGCASITATIDGVTGAVNRTAENAVLSATGIAGLQDSMVALIVYTSAFYAGGFMYGYDNFSEGEGVEWKVTSRDEEEESVVTVERALLKRLNDGTSWWQLSYRDEESEFLSEALVGSDFDLLIFRYRDPETDELREWKPEPEEESSMEKEQVEEEAADDLPGYYDGSWESHIVGRENVKVPAGTYSADHVLVEEDYEYYYVDDEGNEQTEMATLRYEWWISDSVPGNLVRYKWEDGSDGTSLTGELMSHGRGYSTSLNSF